jgi:hypothetical protein
MTMKKISLLWLLCFAIVSCPFAALATGTFTIPDWVMKSCVFIMQGEEAKGTGFLIGVKEQQSIFCYFITARHVIQSALQNNSILRLRLNRKDGSGAEVVQFPMTGFTGKAWAEHGNPAVDLAVAPLAIFDKVGQYDVQMHTVDSATDDLFATQTFIQRFKIRPGDSAFTLGLVPYLFSKDSENMVMTRSGTISMIGTKELRLPGGSQKAHFLDCPAFGGQSGGPAFVLLQRNEEGAMIAGWRIALLGVVTEFVPSPLRGVEVTLTEKERQKTIIPMENTGISKVVPVDYLVELLFSQEQREFRKMVHEEKKKSSTALPEQAR